MSDKAQSSLGAPPRPAPSELGGGAPGSERARRGAPGSERTPSRDRAGGEDPPRHLPTMGELAASWRGRRRWVWVAAAGVVVALAAYGVVHALTARPRTAPAKPITVAADTGPVTTQVATTGTLQPAQTRSLSFAVA